MRRPGVVAAFGWADRRLQRSTAAVLFSARFIPFGRLAVNLSAGAARLPLRRYLPFAGAAALVWAVYQSFIGAAIARLLPDAPALAVIVSILVALTMGVGLDVVLARRWRRARPWRGVARRWEGGAMASPTDGPLGYDPGFLGPDVPLPVALGGRPQRTLDYLHFSVVLDVRRRLACVTGVNIDGEVLRDPARTGEWHFDPRVPEEDQAGPAIYAANDLDRGHLVRRRDPGWGTDAVAVAATEQTFAYPNAAPQASDFNQSTELWLGLEDHVLHYADAQRLRLAVFTAPVLAADDPPYRGIQVPRRFWKVAAWNANGVLAAAGFVLDQSELIDVTVDQAVAVPPLGGFRTFQVPLVEIETLAAVDLGPLVAADVTAAHAVQPGSGWIRLRRASEIRLTR